METQNKRPVYNNSFVCSLAKEVKEIDNVEELYELLKTGDWIAIGHSRGVTIVIRVV